MSLKYLGNNPAGISHALDDFLHSDPIKNMFLSTKFLTKNNFPFLAPSKFYIYILYIYRFIQYIYKVSKKHREKNTCNHTGCLFCEQKPIASMVGNGRNRPPPPRLADQQREVWARSLDSSFQHILRRYGGTGTKKGEHENDGKTWKITPWKINMEPTNHPFRKESDLPNLHDYVPWWFTLPETNIAPKNRPVEKEIPIGNHHF